MAESRKRVRQGGTDLISVGEAAKELGVTPQRVRDMEGEGLLPEAQRIGPGLGHRVYRRRDVEKLRRQREAKK